MKKLHKDRLKNWNPHDSQRGYFAKGLYELMANDENVWLITADLGYKMFNYIKEDFPDRFINVGAAEQSLLGVSTGLAYEGKTVFTYTISSFYMRAAEIIALYLKDSDLPIIMVGGGRGDDYKDDGISHWAYTTEKYMSHLVNINSYYPTSNQSAFDVVDEVSKTKEPIFLSLRR